MCDFDRWLKTKTLRYWILICSLTQVSEFGFFFFFFNAQEGFPGQTGKGLCKRRSHGDPSPHPKPHSFFSCLCWLRGQIPSPVKFWFSSSWDKGSRPTGPHCCELCFLTSLGANAGTLSFSKLRSLSILPHSPCAGLNAVPWSGWDNGSLCYY